MKVDIGFGHVISPSPSLITYPTILPFPSPKIRGYTPETVIAEKFQTIVSRGIDNSRMKDFYDIWTLQRKMNFEGSTSLGGSKIGLESIWINLTLTCPLCCLN